MVLLSLLLYHHYYYHSNKTLSVKEEGKKEQVQSRQTIEEGKRALHDYINNSTEYKHNEKEPINCQEMW